MSLGLRVFGLGVASAIGYAIIARAAGAAGFPLDDAWIHQTYARNLGWHGQWAFILDQPSAGSTSPLWTMALAIGYALRLDYAIWTLALNAVLLGALAWLTYKLTGHWWAGALAAIEWHLAWAAASGMETILFCVLAIAVWVIATKGGSPVWGGVLTGLSVWTRPDGLLLLPFIGWSVWAQDGEGLLGAALSHRVKRLSRLAGGAAAILIPYFVFNIVLSGQVWPNTFFAKQAEYAVLFERVPGWRLAGEIFASPFVGALLLLLPGIALGARGRWIQLLWVCTFLLSYALRLPVAYQHGRYLIPVIPMLIVAGSEGLARWVQLNAAAMGRRVLSRAWVSGVGAAAAAFWLVGASALVADLTVIDSEMVATAKWAAANVPSGSVVAAHDIGALGYFAQVQLIDLAGLVSPDVIPLMNDEARLWGFVQQNGAEYLITYPGWCPGFTREAVLRPVFQTGPLCDPANPNSHMTVYAFRR